MTALFAWKWHSGQLASKRLSKSAMAFDLTRLSPRGWAVFVVVAGGAIATAFLRRDSRSGSGLSESIDYPRKSAVGLADQQTMASGIPVAQAKAGSPPAHFELPPRDSIPYPTDLALPQPVTTEFPAWARKPSLLDSLIQNPSQSSSSTFGEHRDRNPTPFRTWASQSSTDDQVGRSRLVDADRHTPFSEGTHAISPQSSEIAQFAWPDAGLPERSIQEPIERTKWPSTELVGSRQWDRDPVIDAEVGRFVDEEHAKKPRPIGASLRSNSVPNRELFIHQPGLK